MYEVATFKLGCWCSQAVTGQEHTHLAENNFFEWNNYDGVCTAVQVKGLVCPSQARYTLE